MTNETKTAIPNGSAPFVPTPPTRENPTPDWRSHRRLPDDRPHPAMVPSHERYVEAGRTGLLTACAAASSPGPASSTASAASKPAGLHLSVV
ncbi:MAG: hypothetical protein KGS72_13680 [Cyanobacteria bacterium REEB67]|nr:hypothetical protein [Cyanobacteria bacterium REEB67]